MLLQDAQDVGDLLTAIGAGAAPADHDPLADIGRREPDLEPVAHASHLFPRIAVSRLTARSRRPGRPGRRRCGRAAGQSWPSRRTSGLGES
jgi:hypothetical protein